MGWIFIAVTLACAVYGQLVLKWQIDRAGSVPTGTSDRLEWGLSLLTNPWVITVGIAAVIATLAWIGALTRFDLSRAYPFVGLTFILTLLGSVVFLGEELTPLKVIGTVTVVTGVIIASQG